MEWSLFMVSWKLKIFLSIFKGYFHISYNTLEEPDELLQLFGIGSPLMLSVEQENLDLCYAKKDI